MKHKHLFTTFFAAAGTLLACANAHAVVLDFEDLSGDGGLPSNYAGLTWVNWNYYDGSQPPYYASSGFQRIYNTYGSVPSLQFGADVTFEGLWMAGYSWGQYVEGYNNGVKIYESAHIANDPSSTFGVYFSLGWAGVDEIRVQSPEGNHYIVDDVEYNTASVPDGGLTLGLLGGAMVGLSALRRRVSQAHNPLR